MALFTLLFFISWVMVTAPHKLSTATETSLLKWRLHLRDKAKPRLSGIFYQQDEMISPVLHPLTSITVLEEVISLLDYLATWGASWSQLSEQYIYCKGRSNDHT